MKADAKSRGQISQAETATPTVDISIKTYADAASAKVDVDRQKANVASTNSKNVELQVVALFAQCGAIVIDAEYVSPGDNPQPVKDLMNVVEAALPATFNCFGS